MNYYESLISVPYTSAVKEKSSDEVPVVGLSNKELMCYLQKAGFPAEANETRWYKDGKTIAEGEKYQLYRTNKLAIFI